MRVSYLIKSELPELSYDSESNLNIVRVNCEVSVQEEGEIPVKKNVEMVMESRFGYESFDVDQYVDNEEEMHCGIRLKDILDEAEDGVAYKDFQSSLRRFCDKYIAVKDKDDLLDEINLNYSEYMVTQNKKFAEYHTEGVGDYFSFCNFHNEGREDECMSLLEYKWDFLDENSGSGKHECKEVNPSMLVHGFIEQYQGYCSFRWKKRILR